MVQLRPALWRHLVLRLHLLIAVVLGVPLVVLGLSGSLLVLRREVDVSVPRGDAGTPHSVSEILLRAQAAAPAGYVAAFYAAPLSDGGFAFVRVSGPRRSTFFEIDPVSLKIHAHEGSGPWLEYLHDLHENLMLGTHQAVGWVGVGMLVLGISGVVNWWSWRGRWQQGFVVRPDRNAVGLCRWLHTVFGIWALLLFLTVGTTGVWLAFPQIFAKVVNRLSPLQDIRLAARPVFVAPIPDTQPMTVDDAVALAKGSIPGSRIEYVAVPLRPVQPYRIHLLRAGQQPGVPSITIFVDPWTKRIIRTDDPGTYTIGEQLVLWQHAIHSGEGLGKAWNFVLCLIGLLPLFFITTGFSMWYMRRRRVRQVMPKRIKVLPPNQHSSS